MIRTEFFNPGEIALLPREVSSLQVPGSPFLDLAAYPSTIAGLGAALKKRTFSAEKRDILCKVLQNRYASLPGNKAVKASLQALQQPGTFTVTTGHQLCLATGPLYFVIKIASVIRLAQQLAAQYPEYSFVPVYWAATEDHDFEEINHFYLRNKKYAYATAGGGAVGRLPAAEALEALRAAEADIPELSVSSLFSEVKKAYASSGTLSDAILRLVHTWFGNTGLVCLDADDPELKQLFAPVMERELGGMAYDKVQETGKMLEKLDAQPQLHAREINLFYLDENSRERIERLPDGMYAAGEKRFSGTAIREELFRYPERFSPNVVLRPVYQECILPNIAYVGGPGELKYWLQLKGVFGAAGIPYPVLVPRDNFLFLGAGSRQRMQQLGLSPADFWQSPGELRKKYVLQHEKDLVFAGTWKEKLHSQVEEAISYYGARGKITASYVAAAEQKTGRILDRLYERTLKDLALKHQNELRQLDKIYAEIFPQGVFQERHNSVFETLGVLGPDPFARLTELCNPLQPGLTCVIYS